MMRAIIIDMVDSTTSYVGLEEIAFAFDNPDLTACDNKKNTLTYIENCYPKMHDKEFRSSVSINDIRALVSIHDLLTNFYLKDSNELRESIIEQFYQVLNTHISRADTIQEKKTILHQYIAGVKSAYFDNPEVLLFDNKYDCSSNINTLHQVDRGQL